MSKHILFIDPCCPKPYNDLTLESEPMGGTEATCTRIAEEINKDPNYKVTVVQIGRAEPYTSKGGVDYISMGATPPRPDTVITLRDPGIYIAAKQEHPDAKHYLWMHDVVSGPYRDIMLKFLTGQAVHMICMSEFHKINIIEALKDEARQGKMRVTRIYGPMADYCVKTTSDYDPYKLVFFSSPHKGLDYVLQLFQMLRNLDPKFTLYIANPGYFKSQENLPEGCISVGSLPHRDLIDRHVRGSLCTFYPNISFPETFGLVMAESVSVGTPVIAHKIGAASEVLDHPHMVMDCVDYKAVVDRVISWKNGARPVVAPRWEFSMQQIMKEWKRLL